MTRKRRNNTFLWYIQILISAILWGFIPIFTRLLYGRGLSPFHVSSLRSLISAGIVFAILFLDGSLKKIRRKDIPFYFFYGFVAISCTYLFYTASIQMNSTPAASILLYTGPAFVNIFNRILYKIPITKEKIAMLLLCFGGCAMVVRIYDVSFFTANINGIAVGLLSGLCYSMTTVLGQRVKGKYDGRMNGELMMLFGSVVFGLAIPFNEFPAMTLATWLIAIGLAVFCSVLPYTLYAVALERIGDGGVASILATLEPVMATLFGIIFLHDDIELFQIIGMLLVVSGVIIPLVPNKVSV